jgi:hypothetical protein
MEKRPTKGVVNAERISLRKGDVEIYAIAVYIPK